MHHACQNDDDSSVSVSPTHNLMFTHKDIIVKCAINPDRLRGAGTGGAEASRFFLWATVNCCE